MLRALMASASGCITLSLALHATLLWGASRHEPSAERHVAVDLVTSAVALGFENASEPPGANRPSVEAREGGEVSRADEVPDAVPLSGPLPVPEPRVARSPQPRTVPKPRVEKAVEKLEAAAPPEPAAAPPEPAAAPASPPPLVTSSPVASPGTLAALDDGALASARTAGMGAPPIVSALPGVGVSRASGNGSASGDGVSSARESGSDGTNTRAALLDYARRVRARIAEQREYPYAARRARLHGTVCLRIELGASGRLLEAEPTCGSSLGPLAKAALAAVAKASPFPPLPAALAPRLTLDVPVIFELED